MRSNIQHLPHTVASNLKAQTRGKGLARYTSKIGIADEALNILNNSSELYQTQYSI